MTRYFAFRLSAGFSPERSWTPWKASYASSAPSLTPVVWMITLTSAFGVEFAFATRTGSMYVVEGCSPFFRAPAASGAATTSTATSAVTRPRQPLHESAFDRESPPRFPVPQRALERCSPLGLPLPLIQFSPFFRLMRAAVERHRR